MGSFNPIVSYFVPRLCQRLKRFTAAFFRHLGSPHSIIDRLLKVQKDLYSYWRRSKGVRELHSYYSREDIDLFIISAIEKVRPDRAPGPDGLMWENYTYSEDLFLSFYVTKSYNFANGLFNRVSLSHQVQILKPNGKIRVITVSNISDSLYYGILNSYLDPIAEAYFDHVFDTSKGSIFVTGGRPGFKQGSAFSFLNYAINRYNLLHRSGEQPKIILLDISNCFPSISYRYLTKVLKELGVNKKLIRNLVLANLKHMSNNPQKFSNRCGIVQGSPISAKLCALVVTHCLLRLKTGYCGELDIRICSWLDDLAIVVPSSVDHLRVINSVKAVLGVASLRINDDKTEILNCNENIVKYLGLGLKIDRREGKFWLVTVVHPSTYSRFCDKIVDAVVDINDFNTFIRTIKPIVVGIVNYNGLAWATFKFERKCFKFVFRLAYARFSSKVDYDQLFQVLKKEVFSGYSYAQLDHNRYSSFK